MADIDPTHAAPDSSSGRPERPSRRRALTSLGVAAGALVVGSGLSEAGTAAFLQVARSGAAPRLKALSAVEYAAVDALTETIIPADAHSPGAHAARVADYIDLLLSESSAETRAQWKAGIAGLGEAAQARFKMPFRRVTPAQRIELLTEVAKHETAPKTPAETFFVAAKDWTIRGYYTSEIGIHRDLRYKGNQFLGEFVGCADSASTTGRD